MFKLEKTFTFEASHRLPQHDGKCARLHGHSWKCTVAVADYELHEMGPQTGMVMDYGELSKLIYPIIENYLDHHHLNETLSLENPTSEEIARWIYKYLKPLLFVVELVSVRVEETCTCACIYSEP